MTLGVRRLPLVLDPLLGEARRRTRRRLLLTGIAALILVGVSASIALGLRPSGGASPSGVASFNGLSAAQHAQTGASQLPPAALEQIKRWNAQNAKAHASRPQFDPVQRLLPETARNLGKMPDGFPIFVLSDTEGEICLAGGLAGGCGPPLSRSNPLIVGGVDAPSPGGSYYAGGVAIDGVTSVSFKAWNREVTVPVKHNIYLDKAHSSAALIECVTAHFGDGSTYRAPTHDHNCGCR